MTTRLTPHQYWIYRPLAHVTNPAKSRDGVPWRIQPRSIHGAAFTRRGHREITGWAAPAAGGPRSRELTPAQRDLDREARLTISEELGHERAQIVVYCGV